MERNQLIVVIVAALLVLAGAYFMLFSPKGGGGKYAGVAISASPAGTSQLPRRTCFMGAEPLYNSDGARVTFTGAFLITNYGVDLPSGSEIYLIFNNEPSANATLTTRYVNGSVVFRGKKDFTFTKELHGSQYAVQNLYGGGMDFDYSLVYCIACEDPLKEGVTFYTNSTSGCCKLPSQSMGTPANPCS
jgi:hypothetical protein